MSNLDLQADCSRLHCTENGNQGKTSRSTVLVSMKSKTARYRVIQCDLFYIIYVSCLHRSSYISIPHLNLKYCSTRFILFLFLS